MQMSKKNSKNYLEFVPVRQIGRFSGDENGVITLEIENKGVFNRVAQKLLKKPKISYIHLDELGSFVWKQIDGEKTVLEIGKEVSKKFQDKSNPLYERLSGYFTILESYNFINWKTNI